MNYQHRSAFTLIELSIVLVIIGLIVGGVLVGRDLINAANVRAQLSQIEKYQQAINTFRGKYGYLPGDMPNHAASQFGFITRTSTTQGEGNGDGVVTGRLYVCDTGCPFQNEPGVFWVDLSTAQLVDGNFSTATMASSWPYVAGTTIDRYIPKAKIKGHVYVSGGGYSGWYDSSLDGSDGKSYFTVSDITGVNSGGQPYEVPSLTVIQAYNIDKKADDGLPQFGRIIAFAPGIGGWASGGPYSTNSGRQYVDNSNAGYYDWSTGGPIQAGTGVAAPVDDLSCYDNGNVASKVAEYSIARNNGAGLNCWLSFRFQ